MLLRALPDRKLDSKAMKWPCGHAWPFHSGDRKMSLKSSFKGTTKAQSPLAPVELYVKVCAIASPLHQEICPSFYRSY
uniref:Uncharacterized protein n=1 Tax=Anguilla anguilla TaxID=7936 RepID=A0A0E9QFQ0_ANGAN